MDINVNPVWDLINNNNVVRVAVIDDGVESHEELEGRVLDGLTVSYCYTHPDTKGKPNEKDPPLGLLNSTYYHSQGHFGHGESCAGIIAASHNNKGIKGISPTSIIIPINIFNNWYYDGPYTIGTQKHVYVRYRETISDISNGIDAAWDTFNADVLSCSWGFEKHTMEDLLEDTAFGADALIDAINRARTLGRNGLGSVVVFASGNDEGKVTFPADIPGVITVGAINKNGNVWKYSNTGASMDLVAPSGNINGLGDITTIDRMGNKGWNNTNYRDNFGGTSAACPQVAGVVALMLTENPNLTEKQVRNILHMSARDLGDSGFDNIYGYGLVDAYNAVLLSRDNCLTNEDSFCPQNIETDVIFNESCYGHGDITIKSGATLTINSTLRMAPNSKIIVEKGAKLVVNGGTITSACNKYWEGIYIEGNRNLPQTESNQGVLVLNDAVIENANIGITTIGNNYDWEKTGGIIQATNSVFRNNNKSVEFLSYYNIAANGDTLDNESYFTHCTFTWDTAMIEPENSYINSHVTMWQVKAVDFTACTFKDERDYRPSPEHTTQGILTNESSYNIKANPMFVQDLNGNSIYLANPTRFNNLTYGIRTASAYTLPCNVERSEFNNNYCGIFATNTYALTATNNTFNLTPQQGYSGNWTDCRQ
ncbi:MAG: S8 family serine peptidase [Bacteroidales bacterium]|nr:S8 family serine peptidase [Bacteroidales bacterium]